MTDITDVTADPGALAARLALDLSPAGVPVNPLVVVPLRAWQEAPAADVARGAALVAGALPVTVGVLDGPVTPGLEPLIEAMTLTLSAGPAVPPSDGRWCR